MMKKTAILDFILLNNYKATIAQNDLLEKHRMALYRVVTYSFVVLYLSFIIMYDSANWPVKSHYYFNHLLFISVFVNFILLNFHKKSKLTYRISIVLFFALLHIVTYKSGGIQNSANAYLLCLILYAFILCGKKTGLICSILTILNFIYFYYLTAFTSLIDDSLNNNDPALIKIDYLVTFIISVFFIWTQSRFLQKTHDEIVESIIGSNKKLLENERDKETLSRLVAENELKALRAQMNPHFTFNVMNSIQYYLSNNETDTAQNYLTKFSSLIRKVLDNSSKSVVVLKDELDALHIYVELEQMRFAKKFEFYCDIDKEVHPTEWYVPSMLIQPFVENAIKHGFSSTDYKGIIHMSFIKNTTTTFQCIITDNGIGVEQAKQRKKENLLSAPYLSHGLQIAQERINVFNSIHESNAFIFVKDLEAENTTGTKIIIELPILQD